VESSSAVGARIRELRERAGVQSKDLAERLGINPSAMSNIESGKRGVKTQELAVIADALSVSPLAILDEESLLSRLPIAPRTDAGVAVENTALDRLIALTELHEVLAQGGIGAGEVLPDLPDVDVSRWLPAAQTLALWAITKLGPLAEGDLRFAALVKAIRDRMRIDVLIESASQRDLAGASITDLDFPLIFVNADQPTPRALFTLAHELGHVLSREGDLLTLDFDLTAHDDRERFANAFAACLLMPEDLIRNEWQEGPPNAEVLSRLLDVFGVSFESLVFRLHNLQLINGEGRDQLRTLGLRGLVANISDQQLAARLLGRLGQRPETKPPDLLLGRTLAGYRQGVVSVRPLAGLVGLDPDQVLIAMKLDAVEALDQALGGMSSSGLTDEGLFDGNPV
jgi:transcriptional regulator with XRE-family HTH domain